MQVFLNLKFFIYIRICGIDQVELLLGSKMSVLVFDFSGFFYNFYNYFWKRCGLSSGEFVTYGKKEKYDL